MRLLARREHSQFELKQKLRLRKFNRQRIESVVERLIELDLLSDRRFAEEYVHFRIEKGDGPLKIRRNLIARGIDSRLIDRVVPDDEDHWIDCAHAVLEKRFRKIKMSRNIQPSGSEISRKKRVYLSGKGYSMETIRKVVNVR